MTKTLFITSIPQGIATADSCTLGTIKISTALILIIVLSAICGFLGYAIGNARANGKFSKSLTSFLASIENYIIIAALLLIIFSIIFSLIEDVNEIAIVILNVFSSIVFSWLLTKKTSIKDFKEKEEELALRSYRHINYIEIAANTAAKTFDSYIADPCELDDKTKLILSSAKEHVKYIQGGINTCKMDWVDLLSLEERQKQSSPTTNNIDDYGTVDTVLSNEHINQEDA